MGKFEDTTHNTSETGLFLIVVAITLNILESEARITKFPTLKSFTFK